MVSWCLHFLLACVTEGGDITHVATWSIPLHYVIICHCDWFNKEIDWPIARQCKVRSKNQARKMLGRESQEVVQDSCLYFVNYILNTC